MIADDPDGGQSYPQLDAPAACPPSGQSRRRWLIVYSMVIGAALITYCRLELHVSIVSTHIAYLPIVLTGVWWGKKALWAALLFAGLLFALKPFMPVAEPVLADLARVGFFMLVAYAVGAVSDRATAAHRAELASRQQLAVTERKLLDAERLASVGQLSAGVAHELNNPLATVVLYAHLLDKQLDREDARRRDLDVIVREATRCRDIVRALLDFARQSRPSRTLTSLPTLLEEVMAGTARRAGAKQVELITHLDANLPAVPLDATQIRQVLINLVDNGIDAVDAGGKIETSAALNSAGDHVEIRVVDNGRGIPPADRSKLFMPFFTTKGPRKGTGLGLSMAYGIIKMHAGAISIDSEVGRGTEVTVSLPIAGIGCESEDPADAPPRWGTTLPRSESMSWI